MKTTAQQSINRGGRPRGSTNIRRTPRLPGAPKQHVTPDKGTWEAEPFDVIPYRMYQPSMHLHQGLGESR